MHPCFRNVPQSARNALRFMLAALLFASCFASAATLQVGANKPFQTITAAVNAAQPGSTIEIDAGVYANETITISKNDLTLRGVGGRAHLKWGTGNYLTNTATIGNGKAIFVISANNVTIENLEFSGAKVVDENGAGIRYEGGNLAIRGSYFHHNENGILGQGGMTSTLLIENSIFEQNGYCLGSCAHNVYIGHMGTFIFRYNKSIDSKEGHTLKSRANVTEVVGNFFSTKNSDGSYEANFPNGGTVYFIGNVVEQGVNAGNAAVIAFGEEGATNPNHALHVVNNTFNNLRGAGTFIVASGAPVLTVKNNIFAGGGSIGAAADSSNKVLTASAFVNAAAGNYRLAAGSAAIDAGVNPGSAGAYNLTPQWEYVEPAGNAARVVSGSALDAGAYEFNSGTLPDATPDAFGFAAQSGVAVNTAVTSNTITPTGYNAATAISVSAGGSYRINGGPFVTAAGTISPSQNVAVRVTAASGNGIQTCATLNIGGVAGSFCATTVVGPPGAPTAVSAAAGASSINVRFSAPASNGGAAITGYAATCTSADGGVPGTNTGGAGATSIQVSRLTDGRRYTCRVTASNAAGAGPASAPSNAVMPVSLAPILNLLLED